LIAYVVHEGKEKLFVGVEFYKLYSAHLLDLRNLSLYFQSACLAGISLIKIALDESIGVVPLRDDKQGVAGVVVQTAVQIGGCLSEVLDPMISSLSNVRRDDISSALIGSLEWMPCCDLRGHQQR
jgi:hypothetical protein